MPATILFPNRASLLESLATEYAASLAAIPDSPFKTQGIAAGNAAADGDDRRTAERRTLRAVTVGVEH